MKARLDKLTPKDLEQIRRLIEEGELDETSDETRALIEKYWPWLLEKLPPRAFSSSKGAEAD